MVYVYIYYLIIIILMMADSDRIIEPTLHGIWEYCAGIYNQQHGTSMENLYPKELYELYAINRTYRSKSLKSIIIVAHILDLYRLLGRNAIESKKFIKDNSIFVLVVYVLPENTYNSELNDDLLIMRSLTDENNVFKQQNTHHHTVQNAMMEFGNTPYKNRNISEKNKFGIDGTIDDNNRIPIYLSNINHKINSLQAIDFYKIFKDDINRILPKPTIFNNLRRSELFTFYDFMQTL